MYCEELKTESTITTKNDAELKVSDQTLDIKFILNALNESRITVVIFTTLIVIAGVIFSFVSPDIYQTKTLLAVAGEENLLSRTTNNTLGSLASLANIGSGSHVADTELNLAILQSRSFLTKFIQDNALEDSIKKQAKNPYLDSIKKMLSQSEAVLEEQAKKNELEEQDIVLNIFLSKLNITSDKNSPLLTVSLDWNDPEEAAKILNQLIKSFNKNMKNKHMLKANRSVAYLSRKINKTGVLNMEKILYQMLEAEQKKAMLADAREEYVFQVIDKATPPLQRFSPQRAKIVITAFFLGIIISSIVVLIYNLVYVEKNNN